MNAALAALPLVAACLQAASVDSRSELPPDVLEGLAAAEDFAQNFDFPGFYALLRAVSRAELSPGWSGAAQELTDWRVLLERPSNFRGAALTVRGVVGRNSQWALTKPPLDRLGMLTQLELYRDDQPLACTVVLTEDARDVPLGAAIRVTGYFVMIRQYYSVSNELRPAAVLVGHGPTEIERPAPPHDMPPMAGLAASVGGGLLLAGVLLWLARRRSRPERGPAPLNPFDDAAGDARP